MTTPTTTTPVALARRVRAPALNLEGDVIHVDDDGWIYWFATDRSCHASRAEFLEAVK